MKNKLYLVSFGSILLNTGCVTSLHSRYVSSGGNALTVQEGAVYQLRSDRIEIAGLYQVLKDVATTRDTPPVVLYTSYRIVPSSNVQAWTVSVAAYADSRMAFCLDPDLDRKGNISYAAAENQITIGDNGMLTGLNYSPEDKSLDIIKNVIGTVGNIASLAATGGVRIAGAPGSPNVTTTEVGTVSFKVTREAESLIGAGSVRLKEAADQVAGSPLIYQTMKASPDDVKSINEAIQAMAVPSVRVASRISHPVTSSAVKQAIDDLAISEAKKGSPAPMVKGVIMRYPGDAYITLSVPSPNAPKKEGPVVFAGNARLVAAGGLNRIKLDSQRFGKPKDVLAFSPSGNLTSWGFGRDSTVEKSTKAAADATALVGTTLTSVQSDRTTALVADRSRITADYDRQVAVVSAQAVLKQSELDLQSAKDEQKAAKDAVDSLVTNADAVTKQAAEDRLKRADTAVITAQKNRDVNEVAVRKAQALQNLGD